ncbi:MAG: YbjN domain-containing protein [Myxococcota bacterium]
MEQSQEIIEDFLLQSGVDYDSLDDGLWIIHDEFEQVDNIVVQFSPPIVVFRVKLMNVPEDETARAGLYELLLRLNAEEMVAGAYGLEDQAVIVTETLQSENIDFNEFQAAVEGLTLAISEHYKQLKAFHKSTEGADA